MTDELALSGVRVRLGDRLVVDGASLTLRPGRFVALLGANGAGKTTLLRAALGLARRDGGEVRLGAEPIERLTPAERARRVAYLPQARPLAWPLMVRDVVALGRYAHGAAAARLTAEDAAAVARALRACALTDLQDRAVTTLSGGELARVHIARALASEAALLIADEPIAALDPLHAWRVMRLMADLAAGGRGVLASLHDPGLAAHFATDVIVLKAGRIIAIGPPRVALSPEVLAQAYAIAARLEWLDGAPALAIRGPASSDAAENTTPGAA